jgi:hypothetical protein
MLRLWMVQPAPMAKTQDPVFEYACHDGNYAGGCNEFRKIIQEWRDIRCERN